MKNYRTIEEIPIQEYIDYFNVVPQEARFFSDVDRLLDRKFGIKEHTFNHLWFDHDDDMDWIKGEGADFTPLVVKNNHVIGLKLDIYHVNPLPESLFDLLELEVLNLRFRGRTYQEKGLNYLSSSVGRLSKLKYLNLSGNNLSELPQSISELKNLEDLNLSRNPLRSIPDWLFEFVKSNFSGENPPGYWKLSKKSLDKTEAAVIGLLQILGYSVSLLTEEEETELIQECEEEDVPLRPYCVKNEQNQVIKLIMDYWPSHECGFDPNIPRIFPPQILLLRNLEELKIRGINFIDIPSNFRDLKHLKTIYFSVAYLRK